MFTLLGADGGGGESVSSVDDVTFSDFGCEGAFGGESLFGLTAGAESWVVLSADVRAVLWPAEALVLTDQVVEVLPCVIDLVGAFPVGEFDGGGGGVFGEVSA